MISRPSVILPSRNEAATIANVALSVTAALDGTLSLIHSDASSDDNTISAFLAAPVSARRKVVRGPPGKGRQIFAAARELENTTATLIIDTDNRAPDPSLYVRLRDEIEQRGADFAVVNYRRHWFEGNLTNHVARPLILASTGVDVEQPISGEIALSPRCLNWALEMREELAGSLGTAIDGYGIDAFLLLTCLTRGGRLSVIETEAVKWHAPSFPHLPQIYAEATPVLFAPRFRSRSGSLIEWTGRFNLDSSDSSLDIWALVSRLRDLGAQRSVRPFPTSLARCWHDTTTSPTELARNLWPYYLEWVALYLGVGLQYGLEAAATFLVDGMSLFLRSLKNLG